MTPLTTEQRGLRKKCPECGRYVLTLKNGSLRLHKKRAGKSDLPYCPGGQKVTS